LKGAFGAFFVAGMAGTIRTAITMISRPNNIAMQHRWTLTRFISCERIDPHCDRWCGRRK
jgi:hypothetical protein